MSEQQFETISAADLVHEHRHRVTFAIGQYCFLHSAGSQSTCLSSSATSCIGVWWIRSCITAHCGNQPD